jgi:hypothetical protein
MITPAISQIHHLVQLKNKAHVRKDTGEQWRGHGSETLGRDKKKKAKKRDAIDAIFGF